MKDRFLHKITPIIETFWRQNTFLQSTAIEITVGFKKFFLDTEQVFTIDCDLKSRRNNLYLTVPLTLLFFFFFSRKLIFGIIISIQGDPVSSYCFLTENRCFIIMGSKARLFLHIISCITVYQKYSILKISCNFVFRTYRSFQFAVLIYRKQWRIIKHESSIIYCVNSEPEISNVIGEAE